MIARFSSNPAELEISGSAPEWDSFADLFPLHDAALTCRRGTEEPGTVPIHRVILRPVPRETLLVTVDPAKSEAVIAASPENLERFGRTVRNFGAKSRRGQTAAIESLGPEHYIDRDSVMVVFHLGGDAAGREGDVGG